MKITDTTNYEDGTVQYTLEAGDELGCFRRPDTITLHFSAGPAEPERHLLIAIPKGAWPRFRALIERGHGRIAVTEGRVDEGLRA